ncbi:MAG: cation:proton antiporter [Gemmatimonadales bacterium]
MTDAPATHFLSDLAVILSLAGLVTVVFQRLRLPVVAGYLMAGVALGPGLGVGLIHDPATVRTLAEIGVVLLMMFVGLEFRIGKLARIGPRIGAAVVIETGLMLVVGFGVAKALGWTRLEGLLAAGVVAISSTAVIAKAFEESPPDRRLRELVYSLLVFEDLVAIVLVAVGTTVALGGDLDVASVGRLLGRLGLLLVAMLGIGLLLVPRLMRAVVALGRRETTLVTSVGLTFLLALITHDAGYSVALGAFVAGMLMSESGASHQIEQVVQPIRDLFAAVFFVAVGMLLEVRTAAAAWPLVLLFTAVVMGGKIVGVSLGAFLAGFGTRTAVGAGLSMAQIGEFSFIIAGLGLAAPGTAPLYPVAVSTAILTAFLSPLLVRRSEAAALWFDRRLPPPLQTVSTLYAAWVEQLGARPGEPTAWQARRRLIWFLAVDAAMVALALIGASVGWRLDPGRWTGWGIPPAAGRFGGLGLAFLVAAPFGFGLVMTGRRLARLLAEGVVPAVAAGKVDQGRAPRRVLVVALELVITLVVGIPLVMATLPFLPPYGAPGVVLALVILLGLAFWRTARDLDSHARAGAELVVHVLGRQGGSTPAGGLDRVREMLPGMGDFEPIRVEPGSAADGASLGELNLRGRTGATVVALSRSGEARVFPSADTRLTAGDLIALTGSHRAIADARDLVEDRLGPPDALTDHPPPPPVPPRDPDSPG